ncbi:MAG: 4Fe-4S double cluster binding domain-containing protein [Acidobacteriota bacterium]
MKARWQAWAKERGYRMVWGDPSEVGEALSEIDSRRRRGELEARFDEENLSQFTPLDEETIRGMRTLVIIAVRRPAHRLLFRFKGGALEAIVPPTYVNYSLLPDRIRADLERNVLNGQGQIRHIQIPLKLVAARLGLVTYGRNNLTYLRGWGSYHQLAGFLTSVDLQPKQSFIPCSEPEAGHGGSGERLQPACRNCRRCVSACPTGALAGDRFLARAERCLTLTNEQPGAWPDWIPPSAHHCLVGCLLCQQACPVNRKRLELEDLTTVFSSSQMAKILAGEANQTDPAWNQISAKLTQAGLGGYLPVLSRNLRALERANGAVGRTMPCRV